MSIHKKTYSIYNRTAGLLVVLMILLASIYLVIFADRKTAPPGLSNEAQLSNPPSVNREQQDFVKTQAGGDCTVSSSEIAINTEEQTMANLVNQYRNQNGLPSLPVINTLTKTAVWTAVDAANRGFLDPNHIDSLGRDWLGRLSDCGYGAFGVDILAKNPNSTAQSALSLFINSPHHNMVILNQVQDSSGGAPHTENWQAMGISHVQNGGYSYWVIYFGLSNDGSGTPPSGGGGGGGGTGGGSGNFCQCADGFDINGNPFVGLCGQSACGTDNKVWACQSQNNWQQLPNTTCTGLVMCPGGVDHQRNQFTGIQNQVICGEDFKKWQCTASGTWQPLGTNCEASVTQPPVTQPPATNTPTKIPTKSPTPIATKTPIPTAGPGTITPTPPTTPSTTPSPQDAQISLNILINGVGGNTSTGENPKPVRTSLPATVELFLNNNSIKKVDGILVFDPNSFSFKGNINLGKLSSGSYKVSVRDNNSIWKELPNAISLSPGLIAQSPPTTLISGDINSDDVLDLLDYNLLISCYGSRNCNQKQNSDLNIDGKVEEKDLNILYFGFNSRSTTANQTVYSPRILAIGYNPTQGNEDIASKYYNINNASAREDFLFNLIRNSFLKLSYGSVNYQIVKKVQIKTFPKYTDGFQYNISNFANCVSGSTGFNPSQCENQKFKFDNVAWIKDNNICQIAKENNVDEIWIVSHPYIMTWESFMVGPSDNFPINGNFYTIPECDKNYIVVDLIYERDDSAVHSFGHKVESIIDYMANVFNPSDRDKYWDSFSNLSKNYGVPPSKPTCGNTHFAPNSGSDYDYQNQKTVESTCVDWKNFPNLKGTKESINCSAWGCSDIGWQEYWLGSLPRQDGEVSLNGKNGKNITMKRNWWYYILYPANAIAFVKNSQ